MPIACSSLIQMSLQDLRIGKIVGDVGLTISCASLAATSGIQKNLKSWYWTNNQETNSSSETLRWGAAAAGILELAAANNMHTTLHKAYNSEVSNNSDRLSACDVDILKAKKQLLSCPEGQKLWNEVEGVGPFSIKCATSEEAPTGAMVWIEKREIFLSETNKEMVKPLLFELNNLKRGGIASLIGQNKCRLDVDEYATATELIEYGTVEDTYKISEIGVMPDILTFEMSGCLPWYRLLQIFIDRISI